MSKDKGERTMLSNYNVETNIDLSFERGKKYGFWKGVVIGLLISCLGVTIIYFQEGCIC